METSKFLKTQKAETEKFFSFVEKTNNRGEYFVSYYQKNKEQLKRLRVIRYKALKLGLKIKVVDGIIGGEKKATKTQKEYNRFYYLKQKQTKSFLVSVVEQIGTTHPPNQKKINNRKKEQATKTYFEKLRDCGTILNNIHSILDFRGLSERGGINKNKGGRPKKLHALTSTERSRKRRAILKANQPANKWQRWLLKMLDNNGVRIETKNKIPWKAWHPLNDWKIWVEKKTRMELMEKNQEWGARTGKEVKYYGRKYYFNWLDNDILKKAGIPDEKRQEIYKKCVEWNERRGVAFVKGTGGLGMPVLSRQRLTDFNISYKGYELPAFITLFHNGQQAQMESNEKEWSWGKPLIVENSWGLAQIFNREYKRDGKGNYYEERNRRKLNKKSGRNIKVYQPAEIQQKYQQLLSEYKENETWQITTTLTSTEPIKANWKRADADPHIGLIGGYYFFFDAYYKDQAKLNNFVGQTLQLELKRGKSQIFLNKIISQTQAFQTIETNFYNYKV